MECPRAPLCPPVAGGTLFLKFCSPQCAPIHLSSLTVLLGKMNVIINFTFASSVKLSYWPYWGGAYHRAKQRNANYLGFKSNAQALFIISWPVVKDLTSLLTIMKKASVLSFFKKVLTETPGSPTPKLISFKESIFHSFYSFWIIYIIIL